MAFRLVTVGDPTLRRVPNGLGQSSCGILAMFSRGNKWAAVAAIH